MNRPSVRASSMFSLLVVALYEVERLPLIHIVADLIISKARRILSQVIAMSDCLSIYI